VLAILKGGWDPTLAIVMAAALIVSIPGFALARGAGGRSWPIRRMGPPARGSIGR